MLGVEEYLKKFQHILSNETAIREVVQEALFTQCSIKCDLKDIIFKKGTVYLNISPVAKGEVYMHKKKILAFLEGKTGSRTISDVR